MELNSGILTSFFQLVQSAPAEWRGWLILLMILASVMLVILFRNDIGDLLLRISVFSIENNKITVQFQENIKQAQKQQKSFNNARWQGKIEFIEETESERPSLTNRDLVLEDWGRLKQIIFTAAAIQKTSSSLSISPEESLKHLQIANINQIVQFQYIGLLYRTSR
ncbi:MAG: hypothetical protein HOP34_04255 [Methylococcaceae bacterium]|nr:hypothetical protein [Methylococcaceae bacterium]